MSAAVYSRSIGRPEMVVNDGVRSGGAVALGVAVFMPVSLSHLGMNCA
jgi:hypothetical protein